MPSKQDALQRIESREKLCRIMQKQTYERMNQLQTPDVDTTRVASNVNMSPTGLTPGETAYLSDEEKAIKLKGKV